ncbi:hypothetical protein [Planktotalea sp.]|uniref:hypothetical protein n=1 Tax=Planktotalea sp. TaxID=2029877 RepID=UPI0025F519A3|nr:hypothetical protein [Planktotalea sp.]
MGLGLGASYEISAATKINAVVSFFDAKATGVKNVSAYGIGVSHNLGGATPKVGVAQNDKKNMLDLGVSFSF